MFKACCITWNCHLLLLFRIPLSQWSDKVRVSPYIDPNFISDRSQNQMSNSPSNHSAQHPTNSASLLPRALQTSPIIDLSRRPRWYQVLKLENFLIAEQTPDQESLTNQLIFLKMWPEIVLCTYSVLKPSMIFFAILLMPQWNPSPVEVENLLFLENLIYIIIQMMQDFFYQHYWVPLTLLRCRST